MRRRRNVASWIAIAALALAWVTPSLSEVSVGPVTSDRVNLIVMGIIGEGPEPFDIRFWDQYRNDSGANAVLNASGDLRDDGRPDFAWDPTTGWPVAVWAYRAGVDHDIAFSRWDGTGWTPVEFLTSSTADEIDPRVTVHPDGTVRVAWWTEGTPDRVWATTRSTGASLWSVPTPVSGPAEAGRRPSVATWNGVPYVAYERDSALAGMAQEVVVSHPDDNNGMTIEIVGHTDRTGPLEPLLHVEHGRLWVDWKQSDGEFCYSQPSTDGGWANPQVTAAGDPSWVGEESTRRRIRLAVLGVR